MKREEKRSEEEETIKSKQSLVKRIGRVKERKERQEKESSLE